MAQVSQLPCDGDGICMLCKTKPSDEEKLTCNTCVTPWHVSCLAVRPETLASTLQWDCPDCTTLTSAARAPASVSAGENGELIAAIRAIESDASLTEQQKAKRRQELLSGPDRETKEKERENKNDVLDIIDENVKCSFCIQLPERPVTTPCGHNFCLKCFLKWTGQGNSTCAKCRHSIPPKMASQPRINSTLVAAIRMARLSKSISTEGPLKVYHFVHNQFRPDKAYTTERAKRNGMANAASGRIFVTSPSDHFGPILAENDPERKQGVLVGECWELRMECRQWGIHYPPVSGIAGQSHYGAQSVVLSGGYEDDEDHGEWFLYTGSGGRDLSGNKRTNKTQSFDQTFKDNNEALRLSCKKGYPVRVVRSYKEKRSNYAPEKGLRYDGIYRIEKCWRKVGKQGFKVCRYLFVRCDNDPAPWTSNEHGDRPRPLPTISELKRASDLSERMESPSWDYDEEGDCWKWKRPPPPSRKRVNTGNPEISEDRQKARRAIRKAEYMSVKEKLLKEFSCLVCKNVMTLPLTTPCAHNFCKPCLEGKFAGQAFTKERSQGGRTLRSQKNVMKCPACPHDISEFLQNPQVNREVMDVIEKLQHRPEDENTKEESTEEEAHACEKGLEALSGDEENDLSNPQAKVKSEGAYASEDDLEALSGDEDNEVSNPQADGKTEGARKRKEAVSKPSTETKPKRKLRNNDAGDSSSKAENAAKEKIVSEDMLDDDNKLEVPVVKSPAKKASTNKEKTNGVGRRGRPRGGAKAKSKNASEDDLEALSGDEDNEVSNPQADVKTEGARKRKEADSKPSTETKPKRKLRNNDAGDSSSKAENAAKEKIVSEDMLDDDNKLEVPVVKSPAKKASTNKEKTNGVGRRGRPRGGAKAKSKNASEDDLEALSGDEDNEVSNPQADVKTEGARKRKEADSKPSTETKPKRKPRNNDAGDSSSKAENAAKEKIVSEDMLDDDNKLEVPVVKSPAKKASTNKEKTNGVARRGRPRGGAKAKSKNASEDDLEALSGDEDNEVSNPQTDGKTEGARKRKEADSKPSTETKPKRKLRNNDAGDSSSKAENTAKEKIDDDNKLEVPVVKSPAKKASTNKEKTNGVASRGRPRGGAKAKSKNANVAADERNDSVDAEFQ